MADIIDQANDLNDQMLEITLRNSRTAAPLPAKGVCYNCFEPLSPDTRFCDADCRDDHERRTRR